MKVSLPIILTFSLALTSSIRIVAGRPDTVDDLVESLVPEHVLAKWMSDSGIRTSARNNVKSRLQKVGKDNSVVFPSFGRIQMDGLEPYSSFKEGAKCAGDGDEPIDCTKLVPITTFSGTKKEGGYSDNDNIQILVANDADGNIMYIKANNGKNVEVLQGISNTNVLTYITDDDIDPEWASQFRTEADEVNTDSDRKRHLRSGIAADDSDSKSSEMNLRRSLRGQIDQQIIQKIQREKEEGRDLQTASLRTIELALAIDASFCSDVGGPSNVVSKVQAVVADVATDYEQSNLMFTAKIAHLEYFCDPSSDPYKQCIDLNSSGCGGYGLLDCFQDYWNANRQDVSRDIAQLFSGTGLECDDRGCVIGCAYVGTACNDNLSYGVNWVTYTTNTVSQSQLVSHEVGHTLGAQHDSSSTNYIMYPSNSGTARIFSEQSVASFLSTTRNTCIEVDEALPPTDPPTPPPTTPSPTPSPTPKIKGNGNGNKGGGGTGGGGGNKGGGGGKDKPKGKNN